MDISTNYNSYITNKTLDADHIKKLDEKKLNDAAQGIEAEFLKVFMKESKKIMFGNEDEENKSPGKDIMTDFMFERFAEQMAMSSPLGISEMIIKDVHNKDLSKDQDS